MYSICICIYVYIYVYSYATFPLVGWIDWLVLAPSLTIQYSTIYIYGGETLRRKPYFSKWKHCRIVQFITRLGIRSFALSFKIALLKERL